MVPTEPMELAPPLGGVNTDTSFYLQPRGTTPDAQNVVPYDAIDLRRRLSRRPGFKKFIDSQVAAYSIQDINTVSVSVTQTESTGNVFSQGASSVTFSNIKNVQADTTFTDTVGNDINFKTGTMDGHSMGCTDEDNNFYVATVTGRVVSIEKNGTNFTEKWTVTLTLSGSGNAGIFGVTAYNGTLYVYCISQTTGAITSPGIYRFSTATGTIRESGPWLQPTTLAYVAGVTTTAELLVAYQGICAGAGVLAVVGSTTLAGGNLVLQQFNLTTGALNCQTTLEAFSSYPCKVDTDHGANFYVGTNLVSGTQKIYKVNGAGATPAAFTTITITSGMKDFCFEPVNFQLGVVGTVIGGAGDDSFRRYDAVAGTNTKIAGYKPLTFTTWNAITADGLTPTGATGTFRIRRSVAAANVDLASIPATQTTDTGTIWSLITSLGVITPRLWVVCAGRQTAPLLTSMQSTRLTRFMVVCGGGLYSARNGEYSNITSSFVNSTDPVVFSTVNNNKLIYTDGYHLKTYDFLTGVAGTLTATAGTLPTDENFWVPRLICTWRNRTVLAGLLSDPYNWFMSSATDDLDFDYDPATSSVTQAIAGNNTEGAGKVPDIITALIPHTDNMLIFGCESAIYRLTGDPADFGRMDLVSDQTGMAFGKAWCKDPAGIIYFFGSRGGIWRMGAADTPQRISTPVDGELNEIDLNLFQVQMAWDDRRQGIYIAISPIDATEEATHYWWDSFTPRKTSYQVISSPGSWWPMVSRNVNHNALCLHVLDSDDPNDRVILWGGRDGYIRFLSPDALDDDGSLIDSYVLIGPVMMQAMRFRISDFQTTMSSNSGNVTWGIQPGECVEAALANPVRFSGTFEASRNHSKPILSDQHVAFIKLSSSARAVRWSAEHMMLFVRPLGPVASRIF